MKKRDKTRRYRRAWCPWFFLPRRPTKRQRFEDRMGVEYDYNSPGCWEE